MTRTRIRTILSLALALASAGACEVDDADLESSSLIAFSITPASTSVDVLEVDFTGTATLAYVSGEDASIEIFVNGASAYVESFDASADRDLAFAGTLPLSEGDNQIVAHLTYNGDELTQESVVTVADGLQAFTVTPAAATVNVFEVAVTNDVSLGFTSDDEAILEIAVNGDSVYLETIDASASKTSQSNPTLPLSRVGPNDIVATLRYQGNELTQRLSVTVDPAEPAVTFPAWTTAYTQSGTVAVALDPAWTVEEVTFRRDEQPFAPAVELGGGDYQLALENLDIGDNELTVRVVSSNRGHYQEHLFYDVVPNITAVFNCGNPSASMLPDTELLERNNHEARTMVGYFGDPDGGHIFAFLIDFEDDGAPYQTVAQVVSSGRTSLMVDLDITRARCGDAPCTQSYGLALYVDDDPVPLCSNGNFGIIRNLP